MSTPTTAADLRAMAAEYYCPDGNLVCNDVADTLLWAADELDRLQPRLCPVCAHAEGQHSGREEPRCWEEDCDCTFNVYAGRQP